MTVSHTRTLLIISLLIAAGFFAASPVFAQIYVGNNGYGNTGYYGSGSGLYVPYTSPYTTPSYYGNYYQNYSSSYYPWDYYCLYYGGYYCHGGSSSGLSITNVSGPNSLSVGQQGTWSVTTSAPANSNISITVNWGDQSYAYPMASAAPQVSQQNTFSHAYSQTGTYTITFTARDSAGRSNISTVTVRVGGVGCTYNCGGQVSFTASPTSGQAPLGVSFTASNVSKDSTYYINYGDGTDGQMTLNPSPLGACYYGSAGCTITYSASASHTYSQAGTYSATLSVAAGCSAGMGCPAYLQNIGTVTIVVTGDTTSTATFSASPTSGYAPLAVQFTAGNLGNNTSAYSVNFGDGGNSSGSCSYGPGLGVCIQGALFFNHTYTSAGTYTAQLIYQPPFTCNAPSGAVCMQMMPAPQVVGTATITVTVGGWGGGPLSITGIDAPTQLSVGQSGTWTVHVNTGSPYLYYSVNWGDQNFYTPQNAAVQTVSVSGTFTHAYSHAGTYSPIFTVTDGSGHSVSSSATVIVSGDACTSYWCYSGTGYMNSGYYTNGYNYGPTGSGYIPGYGCTGSYCPQ